MTEYWIDIETGVGAKLGDGPITSAEYWQQDDPVDQAGTFEFAMPLADPRRALVTSKRVARCWAIVDGAVTEIGSGVIDQITVQTDKTGRKWLIAKGDGLVRELTNSSVGMLQLSDGSGGGVADALDQVLDFASSWGLDPAGYASTTGLVYGQYAGQLVLAALDAIAKQQGEHWRKGPGRTITWLRTDQADSGLRAVQDIAPEATNTSVVVIENLEELTDSYEMVTRIYPFGAGNAEARLTLAPSSATAPAGYTLDYDAALAAWYLADDDAETTYGVIARFLSWKDIAPVSNTAPDLEAAADTLYVATYNELRRRSTPQAFYRLAVQKLEQVLRPGDTIHVNYFDVQDGTGIIDIDDDLYILSVQTRLDAAGLGTIGLTVATVDRWPTDTARVIAEQIAEARVFEAHPQLSPNSYTVSYREAMDSSAAAEIPFWLGRETLQVNEVKIRFKIDPLRSTVKSVGASTVTSAAGGGSTQTSSSGGASTVTSASGGGETLSKSDHQHFVVVFDGDDTDGDPVYFDAGSGGIFYADYGGGGSVSAPASFSGGHEHVVSAHTHDVSVPAHTHDVTIPTHTHDVTPVITTVYGLFEESGANTLAIGDLAFKINGGSDLAANVVALSGGWYELDLTSEVSDAVSYRPLQDANELEISTATADKTCTITAQLLVRNIIQAIAYT